MADIESILLRLAASDLDSASAATHSDEDIEKAKELVEDASVRRQVADSVGLEAAKTCTAYASYERVLSVLTTALFCETKRGDRDLAVLQNLAECICVLIGSSAESSTRLLSTAKSQIRIKSDTVSEAFAKVSPENKDYGDALAKATAKSKRKQSAAESLAATEQDVVAKSRARRMSSISRPGAHAVSGDEANALDQTISSKTSSGAKVSQEERDAAAKSRARRSTKIREGALVPGVVREPSLVGMAEREPDSETNRIVSSASAELSRLESDVVAKSRARSSSGFATKPGVVRETSSDDVVKDRLAKARARRSVSASASAELTQLESDVVSKSRARRSSGRVHAANSRQSSAASRLHDLEADIVAKSGSKSARKVRKRGSDRTNLNSLEDDVLAKSRNQSSNSKKHQHLPPSQVPGVYFEREDGQNPECDDDMDEWDKEWEKSEQPYLGDSLEKDNGRIRVDEGTGALLGTDRGIVNEPHVEFGQYDGAHHLYADIGDGCDPATGLAVAVAVTADEEETFIPSAVECDPDAKPPITRNRRFRLYVGLAFVLLILIVTVVTVVMTQGKDESSSAPTPAPTSVAESSIRNQLQIVVGEDRMNDKTSPEAMAADWIIYEDPMQLSSDSPNLIQRYVLALFYLSTTQESPWLSCNRPEDGQGSECLYKLLTAVFPFIVYEQVEWYRWLSNEHECDWAGVYCDDTEVVRALELWGQEISGTLPAEFKELTYMQSIALQWNNFHGTLPKEWAEMQHLLNIEVHYNWLDGEVPQEWWTSSRWAMQRLNIAANQFSGTVPTEIGQLHGLKGYFSYENQMTGTFPTELGNIEFLAFTRQGRNFIEGTLPTELGKLEKMQEMWLHRNKITGTIPTELGLMSDLGDLRLHFNPLTGTIPQEFYNFTELTRLDLYDCELSGTISTEVGKMRNMASFRIRTNNFSGTIPTEIGQLFFLEEVWAHRTKLTGTVPSELCDLRSSAALIGLQAVEADCAATTTATGFGPPQIECPPGCCTRCCDGNTGICDN